MIRTKVHINGFIISTVQLPVLASMSRVCVCACVRKIRCVHLTWDNTGRNIFTFYYATKTRQIISRTLAEIWTLLLGILCFCTSIMLHLRDCPIAQSSTVKFNFPHFYYFFPINYKLTSQTTNYKMIFSNKKWDRAIHAMTLHTSWSDICSKPWDSHCKRVLCDIFFHQM